MYVTTIKHVAFLFMGNVTNTTNDQTAVSNPSLKRRLQSVYFLTHKAYCCPEELAHMLIKYTMESNLNI